MELDEQASVVDAPFGIITADCTGAHEYDDGIAVTPLPSAEELYRVHVFAVDTSSLYNEETTVKRVLERTESLYGETTGGTSNYLPMLETPQIKRLHFAKGNTRDALTISFLIGAYQPPSDVTVGFGKVDVMANLRYDKFGHKCRRSPNFEPYARAAALIMKHLRAPDEPEDALYHNLIHVPPSENFKRGSNINQSFMIGANYLVAALLQQEGRLAIYRTHDTTNGDWAEILSPRVAHYSKTPGKHDGLGLDVYTRVTSPLRRAEDFILHGLLRARADGRALTKRDEKIVQSGIQRLNQRIASLAFKGKVRLADEDLWHRNPNLAVQQATYRDIDVED